MAKPIKIIVKGTDNAGDDAPTVADLLSQIQDQVTIFKEVEEAIDDGGKERISWRVTDVTKNSPITFEITPYPKAHGVNIDTRAEEVLKCTASGIKQLVESGIRSAYFNDNVVKAVKNIGSRLANGLAGTEIIFSEYADIPDLEINSVQAHKVVSQAQSILTRIKPPHRELGSIEGYINKVELDGFNRPIVWLKTRIDNQSVKCVSTNGGLDRIGHFEVAEVLKGLRVLVYGMINYKNLDNISSIEVSVVNVFENNNELPDYSNIVDPDFTDGVESVEYLKAIRNDV